jgi:hypothetical protein
MKHPNKLQISILKPTKVLNNLNIKKMKIIVLTHQGKNKGKYSTKVDDWNHNWLNQWKWYAFNSRGIIYAARRTGKNQKQFMHNLIMATPAGLECDHADKDGLNNQECNLRNCTRSQNNMNRKCNGKSIYTGISFRSKKYIGSRIRINGEIAWLGTCKTEIQAAKRYDAAARYFYGEFANLNFKI